MKRLGIAHARTGFNAAQPQQRQERFFREPKPPRLAGKMPEDGRHLAARNVVVERDEVVRLAQIAVIFRNLVFENGVMPERVPREIRQHAMVLMSIVPAMSQDEVRLEPIFDPFEPRRRCEPIREGC